MNKVGMGRLKSSYNQSALRPIRTDISLEAYEQFLRNKVTIATEYGFKIDQSEISPILKPHQKDSVQWAVAGGRRAIFSSFGLGKSVQQLEILRLILKHSGGGRGLIVAPLGVRQEFKRDARELLGFDITFVRSMDDVRQQEMFEDRSNIYITNYETVREGKLDPANFTVATLDESAILSSMGGTKTYREFMVLFEKLEFLFVATATPDPNEYLEILAYAAFLRIMDISAAKTKFFKRDSTKADALTIHPHKVDEFWAWTASWALWLQAPSDLGYSDDGYALPELEVVYHEVTARSRIGELQNKHGQFLMFQDASLGVQDAAREKRDTLTVRVEEMKAILAAEPDKHFLLWHDLEKEREAIEKAVPGVVTVYGKMTDLAEREQSIMDFANGKIKYFGGKPSMLGAGCNFQRHCSDAIFLGIGFKFRDFIQSVHRLRRYLQPNKVRIHLIFADTEKGILQKLLAKWNRYTERANRMSEIIKKFGLSEQSMMQALQRKMGVERVEVTGSNYKLVNNDCVYETKQMADNSVGLILTSIPFSSQYEYSPSYNDFGHSDSNASFFEQMDFLTPELLRVLQPGRIAAIHVKDRIVPGGMTGLGFQTAYPFHSDVINHYIAHGFGYLGMKTIVTDVVRENNQTYRLGWTEQCKDGTKMGVGMPEYLLLFRKPPTDMSNAYADDPVEKQKGGATQHCPNCDFQANNMLKFKLGGADGSGLRECPKCRQLVQVQERWVDGYSRSRWQIDAHGFMRSSGNRKFLPEELEALPHHAIFKLFRDYSLNEVYDFEYHVAIGEALERKQRLPVTFMLLQPASWHLDVWTDITRMRTLNGAQSAKGKQMHLCPMQFDIAERVIAQMSAPGDVVYDPYGGLMTVPMTAVKNERFGYGVELSPNYFADGCLYVESAARGIGTPGLFDMGETEECIEVEDNEAAIAA